MKEIRLSNRSFERTAKRFNKLVVKHIKSLDFKDRESELLYNSNELLIKLTKSYNQNSHRKMSGFVYKLNNYDQDIMNYIKVWYIFDNENKTITFKYSEKYSRKFNRKVKFILSYEKK